MRSCCKYFEEKDYEVIATGWAGWRMMDVGRMKVSIVVEMQ